MTTSRASIRTSLVVLAAWLALQVPSLTQGERGAAPAGGQTQGGTVDPLAAKQIERMMAPLARLTPVTDQMLLNPPPGDWLHWRRTYDGYGFSPLTQINRNTVKNLRVAWTWNLAPGMNEVTPIVHDGVLFMWNYAETLQALDARNGNLLWQFKHPVASEVTLPNYFRTKRSIAIGDNKLIVATHDLHLIALDIKTGKVLWETVVDDFKTRRTYTAGPLIVKGKVLTGSSACSPGVGVFPPGGCYLTAHDLQTGKELWRFQTVARPGEPGGNTWNDLPLERRGGASIWTTGTYDPELNLTYWGTGSPAPWSAIERGTHVPTGTPGTTSALLYVNSTLAINPDTGKLAWHYQHLPADSWDLDYAFERIIVPVDVGKKDRKAVITVGKPGIFEAMDAATGEFLFARDTGVQTIVKALDPRTGVKTIIDVEPGNQLRCPSTNGARNFHAGAYSPITRMYYLGIYENCNRGSHPKTLNGELGRVVSLDIRTTEFAWNIRSRVPQSSAMLATGGGLVFSASVDRYMRALDDRTGKVLWETRVNDVPNAFPITYMVDGKQYIAMEVGDPGTVGNTIAAQVPEIRSAQPPHAPVLWVWELP